MHFFLSWMCVCFFSLFWHLNPLQFTVFNSKNLCAVDFPEHRETILKRTFPSRVSLPPLFPVYLDPHDHVHSKLDCNLAFTWSSHAPFCPSRFPFPCRCEIISFAKRARRRAKAGWIALSWKSRSPGDSWRGHILRWFAVEILARWRPTRRRDAAGSQVTSTASPWIRSSAGCYVSSLKNIKARDMLMKSTSITSCCRENQSCNKVQDVVYQGVVSSVKIRSQQFAKMRLMLMIYKWDFFHTA